MTEDQLLERIVRLEFQNDQLATEVQYVDFLFRTVGFVEGLPFVKRKAKESTSCEDLYDRIYEDGLPSTPPGVDD